MITGYELSRQWFDWCFENPEKVKPIHIAIYFFSIEHKNRLGWKEKFGFPSQMVMDAIGVKKYQTYISAFNDLVEWGFFDLVEKSKNQYSANIISIKSAMPKNGKALDKAIAKHRAKQIESTGQSTWQSMDSIDKPINQEPINNTSLRSDSFEKFWNYYGKKGSKKISRERFMKLSETDIESIRKHLPAYLKSTPERKFRKDAERYLSNRLWENDDIEELKEMQTEVGLPKNWFNIDLTPEQWKLVPKEHITAKRNADTRRAMGV